MKKKYLLIILVSLVVVTTAYTLFVFIPSMNHIEEVDTSVVEEMGEDIEAEEETEEEELTLIQESLGLEEGKSYIYDFDLLNREIPLLWSSKEMRLKYTYLGEYSEEVQKEVDILLDGEYSWEKQLDSDGDIVLGGPLFIKDGIYQLHVHNGLSFAGKYYLLGDLLHGIYYYDTLVGTEIKIGDVTFQAKWVEEMNILEDSTISNADLVISTCLARGDSDRRLVSGWIVIE